MPEETKDDPNGAAPGGIKKVPSAPNMVLGSRTPGSQNEPGSSSNISKVPTPHDGNSTDGPATPMSFPEPRSPQFVKVKNEYKLEDFTVKVKLGKGAFGNVYLVELDASLNAAASPGD